MIMAFTRAMFLFIVGLSIVLLIKDARVPALPTMEDHQVPMEWFASCAKDAVDESNHTTPKSLPTNITLSLRLRALFELDSH